MNQDFLNMKTPYEIQREIAINVRALRKAMGMTQMQLADRSGVSLGSLKRFEQSGEISLASLLKIAMVMGRLRDFERLFAGGEYRTIKEVIDEKNR